MKKFKYKNIKTTLSKEKKSHRVAYWIRNKNLQYVDSLQVERQTKSE